MKSIQPTVKQVLVGATALMSFASATAAYAHEDVIALAPTARVSDPTIQQASDYLVETNRANELKNRRRGTRPGFDSRVVKQKRDLDKILILGGSDVIPM